MIDVSVCNCQTGVTAYVLYKISMFPSTFITFILPSSFLLDCFGLACLECQLLSLLFIYLCPFLSFLHNCVCVTCEKSNRKHRINYIETRMSVSRRCLCCATQRWNVSNVSITRRIILIWCDTCCNLEPIFDQISIHIFILNRPLYEHTDGLLILPNVHTRSRCGCCLCQWLFYGR